MKLADAGSAQFIRVAVLACSRIAWQATEEAGDALQVSSMPDTTAAQAGAQLCSRQALHLAPICMQHVDMQPKSAPAC